MRRNSPLNPVGSALYRTLKGVFSHGQSHCPSHPGCQRRQVQRTQGPNRGGADFAEVAKANSTCPSSRQGGDLGSFGPGQMVKEFDTVVFSAPINVVQGPVKTQFGYHLLEVTSRQD